LKPVFAVALAVVVLLSFSCAKKIKVGPEEARVIAKEAYIYGLPMVDNYRVMYSYAVYKDSGAYKAPFNRLAIVMPDTTQSDSTRQASIIEPPYALSWLDLRKDAVVLTIPSIYEGQEFHVQLVDLYTHNFAELGTKQGIVGGSYMIVKGPWAGEQPSKVAGVIQCETSFALAIIRGAPLHKGPTAMEAFLTTFDVETLSAFNGEPPKKTDTLIFPPYSTETALSVGFFQYMNFLLQFCPVHPSEIQERASFAKLGIAAGKHFNVATMDHDMREAVEAGMSDARATIAEAIANTPAGAARYGSREQLKNDFLARAAAAKIHLYGNSSP
jgi:hypothetical protein